MYKSFHPNNYKDAIHTCAAEGSSLPSGESYQLSDDVISNHGYGETWIQVTGRTCPNGCWLDGNPFVYGMCEWVELSNDWIAI